MTSIKLLAQSHTASITISPFEGDRLCPLDRLFIPTSRNSLSESSRNGWRLPSYSEEDSHLNWPQSGINLVFLYKTQHHTFRYSHDRHHWCQHKASETERFAPCINDLQAAAKCNLDLTPASFRAPSSTPSIDVPLLEKLDLRLQLTCYIPLRSWVTCTCCLHPRSKDPAVSQAHCDIAVLLLDIIA